MKYRTIEEARALQIPEFPISFAQEFELLGKRIRLENESKVGKLRKIYNFADKLGAFIAPYMVCQKGCSHCCRIDVSITSIEAQYIYKNTGIALHPGSSFSGGHSKSKNPCTFLDGNNICTIYENRPLTCRIYYVADSPIFCQDTNFSHVEYRNNMLIELFRMIFFINDNHAIRDIRDFFPKHNKT